VRLGETLKASFFCRGSLVEAFAALVIVIVIVFFVLVVVRVLSSGSYNDRCE
jgi:hypothetical protein